MALGMKRWIGVVLAGMALMAVWNLPPGHLVDSEPRARPAVVIRHERLTADLRETADALRRVRWGDSLSALAVERAEDDFAFAVFPSPYVQQDMVERLENAVRKDFRALAGRRPGVLFGYVHQPYEHGNMPGMPRGATGRTETYAGTRDGVEYCLQVRVSGSSWPSRGAVVASEIVGGQRSAPASDRFGPCRFYLRHGMPGPHIHEWLVGGGATYAIEEGEKPMPSLYDQAELRAVAAYRLFRGGALSGLDAPIEVDGCRAGKADACAAVFVEPALAAPRDRRDFAAARRAGVVSVDADDATLLTRDDHYLLSDLEAEFGPEAFQAFWRSEEDVATAFETAFGLPVGEWLAGWVARVGGAIPATPALPRSASTGSALALALLLGWAFLRNRRRVLG